MQWSCTLHFLDVPRRFTFYKLLKNKYPRTAMWTWIGKHLPENKNEFSFVIILPPWKNNHWITKLFCEHEFWSYQQVVEQCLEFAAQIHSRFENYCKLMRLEILKKLFHWSLIIFAWKIFVKKTLNWYLPNFICWKKNIIEMEFLALILWWAINFH